MASISSQLFQSWSRPLSDENLALALKDAISNLNKDLLELILSELPTLTPAVDTLHQAIDLAQSSSAAQLMHAFEFLDVFRMRFSHSDLRSGFHRVSGNIPLSCKLSEWCADAILAPKAMEAPDDWFTRLGTELGSWQMRIQRPSPDGSLVNCTWRLAEVELYVHSKDHADPYVHRHAIQATSKRWYFHRPAAAKIGFTLKGMDISVGAWYGGHGGLLIRALRASDGTMIDGPSKVVDAVLTALGVTSVAQQWGTSGDGGSVFAAPLWLEPVPLNDTIRSSGVSVGPRIGLKAATAPAWCAKKYRMRWWPELAKHQRSSLVPLAEATAAKKAKVDTTAGEADS
eukprot:TRINITY_DN14256_c0_g1_i1.p1 TRINITY_DN14256_c0_g1~~TRINITY_DN14256_c0_g1_i1.p1  ORF type:complete len:355 (+),score=63.85 TRINITY_DN14256_c0_g1_i1:38-1066(+)